MCFDFITEGWTSKDWVLNLIPLGGVACVAYEIGSACLGAEDQTAEISEDFLESPILTTIKKIAQCLWFPIVLCGALKLISILVTACWNQCFPSDDHGPKEETTIPAKNANHLIIFDPTAKDPCGIIPQDVILEIFSCLSLHQLGVSNRVSKTWNPLASTVNLWKAAVYREFALTSKNCALWDEEIVKGIDYTKEMLSLPDDTVEKLRLSYKAFPGKNIRETHVLVGRPKGLTLKKLGELAKKYFPSNPDGYQYIRDKIVDELGDEPADEFDWLLMTTDVIDGTRDENYEKQKNIVAELAETSKVPYKVPMTLDAATCILAEYSRSEKRLFSDDPWTYTRCQENVQGYQVVVGGFAPVGLDVDDDYFIDYAIIGVAALRKF